MQKQGWWFHGLHSVCLNVLTSLGAMLAEDHMGICEKEWSEDRNIESMSVGHSNQKLWPNIDFEEFHPCISKNPVLRKCILLKYRSFP